VPFTIKNYVPDIFPIPKAMPTQLGALSCMSQNMNSGPHQNPSTDAVSFINLRHMKTAITKPLKKKGGGGGGGVGRGLMFWPGFIFGLLFRCLDYGE
jgi:hypothetical protein